jgi:hypothetical protein
LSATYMGNVGRHIWGSTDINYAVSSIPGASTSNTNNRRLTYLANAAQGQYYGDIQQTDDGANSEYNSLLLSAKKNMSHGLFAQVNYNWSRCISSWDFAGELAGTVYQNPLNRATGERGNCGYDHRQNFIATFVAVSQGLGEGFAKYLTKDWQLSPSLNLFTGSPIQLADGKDISLSGQNLDRPTVLVAGQTYGTGLGSYLNLPSFACAGSAAGTCTVFSGQFGNLGRNTVYGPGTISWDMSLDRKFRLKERLKMDFRADFFNIMNHANWNNPGNSLSSSTFGQITGFGSPRIIQMAMKLLF